MEQVTWQNLNERCHMTKLEWNRSHDKNSNGTGHMTELKWNRSHDKTWMKSNDIRLIFYSHV